MFTPSLNMHFKTSYYLHKDFQLQRVSLIVCKNTIFNYMYYILYCRGGGKPWHVFYHFVGAVPGSTELERMLKRLLRELKVCDVRNRSIHRIFPI